MKLNILLTFLFAAAHNCSSSSVLRCPLKDRVVICPGDGTYFNCGNYCTGPLPDPNNPVQVRFLCLNTNPPVMCPLGLKPWCEKYCQSVAGTLIISKTKP